MNDTLKFILKRYQIDPEQKLPISLNISRFTELPKLFRKLGFKTGAEIGVSTGRYSKALCQRIPGLKLYCIDPWLSYEEYVECHTPEKQIELNACLERAKERLTPFGCEFIRKFSMDAVKDFKDNSLDFVFIDGNHSFRYVIDDIDEWTKKVRPGGIVAGHDFWRSTEVKTWVKVTTEEERITLCQVQDAVLGWTYANYIKPWFTIIGDKCPSFFWVKEK